MTANSKSSFPASPKLAIPGIIFLLGIMLTLWLKIFVSDGVFFSSDAGLKALLSQQIAEQIKSVSFPLDMALTLKQGTIDWVAESWRQGLQPIVPPFAYELRDQLFIAFPFIFPLVTAPFYALFGESGLYIVPILALWMIWGRFWQIGLRAGWDAASLSLGLFALIFAAPLSLYGSTYWEHTLAAALAFWGITALLYPRHAATLFPYLTGTRLLLSGVLIGLSVWFRPEFLCVAIAVFLLTCCGWLFHQWRLMTPLSGVDVFVFTGSAICTVGVFLALNYGVYGHPLGLHGLQIVDNVAATISLPQAKAGYGQMLLGLWRYFPIAALVFAAALCSPEFKRSSLKTTNRFRGFKTPNVEEIGIISPAQHEPQPGRAILFICFWVALLVPLLMSAGIGGRQWGPRLYLILMPLLSIVLAEQLRVGFFQDWARRLMLIGTAIAMAFGIHMNTLNGAFNLYQDPATRSTSLWANYVSVEPALTSLRAQPSPWIATNTQFVAHQFWSALPDKTFFRTQTSDALKQLADTLAEQEESAFTYVCAASQNCPLASELSGELTLESGRALSVESVGQFGRYLLYTVEITP